MVRFMTGRPTTMPVLVLSLASVYLIGGAVWGEAQRKPRPTPFPLSLFAAAKADDYVDDQVCAGCHAEIASSFGRSYHAALVRDSKLPKDRRGCQSCHGPGSGHIANMDDADKIGQFVVRYGRIKPEEASAGCLRCHGGTMHAAQWSRQPHARGGLGCTSCHTVHHSPDAQDMATAAPSGADPRPARSAPAVATTPANRSLKKDQTALCASCHRREMADFRRNFHHPVPEGSMECSDCHELHPTKASSRNRASSRGACVRCHRETAGPFRFEHEPVTGWTGDGCTECHKPHGSQNPALLNSFSRGLCAQCHTDLRTTHYPAQTCWSSGCHEAVHGSNRDRTLLAR